MEVSCVHTVIQMLLDLTPCQWIVIWFHSLEVYTEELKHIDIASVNDETLRYNFYYRIRLAFLWVTHIKF